MNALPRSPNGIAFFSEVYKPIINGVVASIDELRSGLIEAQYDVALVTPFFPNARADDANVIRLPSLALPNASGYRFCIPRLPRAAYARIKNATVVHAHSPFITGRLAANFARRLGVPLVFTYHTRIDEYAHYAPFEPRIARAAMIALTRAFANRANAVIAPTHAMHDRLREIGVTSRIAVIPSAIDVSRFANGARTNEARALLGARDDVRVALAVSRIAKEKNLELAIDALAFARDVRLAIVGDGPHRAQLEARARERGVRERVTFAGAQPPAALPDLYASSDVFAFPSETETQGLVLAEALAAGLPVVAVAAPVNREMLAGAGRIVDPDPAAFGAALSAGAATPRDLAAAGDAALRFGRGRQTAAVAELYKSL